MDGLKRGAALAAIVWLAAAAPAGAKPSPGAAGAGDPLFPGLGNGGYDVRHYTLDLRYRTRASVQRVPGVVTVRARATQALSRFDLDFSGRSVASVAVAGRRAAFRRRGAELAITPRRPIAAGRRFTVRVAFVSGPRSIPSDAQSFDDVLAAAWFATPSGSITAAQPAGAHRIFPCDDVPSDPATFTIRASTPAGSTFVANGERTGRPTTRGRTLWTYRERRPMATELIQLAFGALTVRSRAPEHGVRLRDVAPTRAIGRLEPALARVRRQLDYMVGKVGRFPFGTYGSLLSDARFPFALEDQTLSLYPADFFDPRSAAPFGDPRFYAPVMVHELAHQWFGDDVMPARWSDVWLNEGHATWYEWEYAADHGDAQFYLGGTFTQRMRAAYEEGDDLRARFGPVAAPLHGADDVARLFSSNVYEGGALVLYALRQTVGDVTFRRIEREWPRRFGGGPARTADFIALASAVARRDLAPFLTAWLYGTKTPPMPGHPDWKAGSLGSVVRSRGAHRGLIPTDALLADPMLRHAHGVRRAP
jgi:aminopeptidase N